MLRNYIIALFISACYLVNAQDYTRPMTQTPVPAPNTDKKFSLSVSVGPAVPLADFASTNVHGSFWDFNSSDSTRLQGFAKTGFHFNITASYLLNDNFGLMVTFGSSSNPFDVNTFSSIVGFPTTTPTGGYSFNEYLIGPFLKFNLVPKLNVQISAMAGIVDLTYPELTFTLNDTLSETIDFQGGLNFGYSFGAGLVYDVSNTISILLNVSYTSATVTYGSWTQTYSIPGYYPVSFSHPTDKTFMVTGLLKQTIGIVLKL
jgi:opacity protein-like surface antigen